MASRTGPDEIYSSLTDNIARNSHACEPAAKGNAISVPAPSSSTQVGGVRSSATETATTPDAQIAARWLLALGDDRAILAHRRDARNRAPFVTVSPRSPAPACCPPCRRHFP